VAETYRYLQDSGVLRSCAWRILSVRETEGVRKMVLIDYLIEIGPIEVDVQHALYASEPGDQLLC
jgi:hypothetical protein